MHSVHVSRIVVGQRPRIVVRAKQNPLHSIRMPLDDHVRHRHRASVERVQGAEFLEAHLRPKPLKMLAEDLLLRDHAGRPARPRPDGTDLLEVLVSLPAVERNLLEP